jgi:hypothetical protein
MGGETEGGWIGSTVKREGGAVLRKRLGNSPTATDVDFTPDTKISKID